MNKNSETAKSTLTKLSPADESSGSDSSYQTHNSAPDLNDNLTARPDAHSSKGELRSDSPDDDTSPYGEMNARDAVISGYTDKDGHAVSMAKHDTKGSPTGSLTDIGAGRSSVVKKKSEMDFKKPTPQIHSLDVTSKDSDGDSEPDESSVNYDNKKSDRAFKKNDEKTFH